MNQVALMLFLSNSFRSLRVPSVPANRPVLIVSVVSKHQLALQTSTDIAGRIFTPVTSQPTSDSINVHTVATENSLFAHIEVQK